MNYYELLLLLLLFLFLFLIIIIIIECLRLAPPGAAIACRAFIKLWVTQQRVLLLWISSAVTTPSLEIAIVCAAIYPLPSPSLHSNLIQN
jgi:hypothetical protein